MSHFKTFILGFLGIVAHGQTDFKPTSKTELTNRITSCLNESPDGNCPTYGPIGDWDTSLVTDMSNVLAYKPHFNQPLNWDTSQVTDFRSMFNSAMAFNSELGLKFMQGLRTVALNNPSNLNTMFKYAAKFRRTLCLSGATIPNAALLVTGRGSDDWFAITGNDPSSDPSTWPNRYFDLARQGCCPAGTYMVNSEYTLARGEFDAATDCAACSIITEENSQATCPAACTVASMAICSAADLETIKQKYNVRSSTSRSGDTCTTSDMSGCDDTQLASIKAKYEEKQNSCSS